VNPPEPEPVFPVGFDDDALAEDLEQLPAGAENGLHTFRKTAQREGGDQAHGLPGGRPRRH
jgi:hypothetical protein